MILHQGAAPGLRRVGWQMEDAENATKIRHHLQSLGIATVDVAADEQAALGIENAFRITEPNSGATFEYFSSFEEPGAPYVHTVTKIERLGHIVLNVKDHPKAEKFFMEDLNFRASDRIEGAVTFMRCFPNPLHHSLGLSNGGKNALHHVNFMVTDVDDIGKALWRMKNNDVPIVFGPGRHPPSDSMFLYFLDPDGITVEYSFGMEEFPEVDPRAPRKLPLGLQSIDYWGSVPSPDMASKGVIEPLVNK